MKKSKFKASVLTSLLVLVITQFSFAQQNESTEAGAGTCEDGSCSKTIMKPLDLKFKGRIDSLSDKSNLKLKEQEEVIKDKKKDEPSIAKKQKKAGDC